MYVEDFDVNDEVAHRMGRMPQRPGGSDPAARDLLGR